MCQDLGYSLKKFKSRLLSYIHITPDYGTTKYTNANVWLVNCS